MSELEDSEFELTPSRPKPNTTHPRYNRERKPSSLFSADYTMEPFDLNPPGSSSVSPGSRIANRSFDSVDTPPTPLLPPPL